MSDDNKSAEEYIDLHDSAVVAPSINSSKSSKKKQETKKQTRKAKSSDTKNNHNNNKKKKRNNHNSSDGDDEHSDNDDDDDDDNNNDNSDNNNSNSNNMKVVKGNLVPSVTEGEEEEVQEREETEASDLSDVSDASLQAGPNNAHLGPSSSTERENDDDNNVDVTETENYDNDAEEEIDHPPLEEGGEEEDEDYHRDEKKGDDNRAPGSVKRRKKRTVSGANSNYINSPNNSKSRAAFGANSSSSHNKNSKSSKPARARSIDPSPQLSNRRRKSYNRSASNQEETYPFRPDPPSIIDSFVEGEDEEFYNLQRGVCSSGLAGQQKTAGKGQEGIIISVPSRGSQREISSGSLMGNSVANKTFKRSNSAVREEYLSENEKNRYDQLDVADIMSVITEPAIPSDLTAPLHSIKETMSSPVITLEQQQQLQQQANDATSPPPSFRQRASAASSPVMSKSPVMSYSAAQTAANANMVAPPPPPGPPPPPHSPSTSMYYQNQDGIFMPRPSEMGATLNNNNNIDNNSSNHFAAAQAAQISQQQTPNSFLHFATTMQQQQQMDQRTPAPRQIQQKSRSRSIGNSGSNNGRRKIQLRLQEEVIQKQVHKRIGSNLFNHIRQKSTKMFSGVDNGAFLMDPMGNRNDGAYGAGAEGGDGSSTRIRIEERGTVAVSWFDGTSSLELQEHVRRSIVRKLALEKHLELSEMRALDDSVIPPEEIVLSPYIPDGSRFLFRFMITDTTKDGSMTPMSVYSGRAPDSPSAAPSPHRSNNIMNATQLALLREQLDSLRMPQSGRAGDKYTPRRAGGAAGEFPFLSEKKASGRRGKKSSFEAKGTPDNSSKKADANSKGDSTDLVVQQRDNNEKDANKEDENANENPSNTDYDDEEEYSEDDEDDMMMHSEDPIEARLREITEMLITDRQKRKYSRTSKRQVIFVLANYFVLFLSMIAISAEIQARAPDWIASIEAHMNHVQHCGANQEALFKCVSNGDFAGLLATIILVFSRSVATKRIFLFGFESPNKLWTVVYECLVTSFCWGFSYLFIRRGMNADTRPRFIQKYWKDAVYGSLAGFNAAFMKQVLKNLIPQEAVEDVLRDRQLKILSWLPSWS